jgi:hypothetical protein
MPLSCCLTNCFSVWIFASGNALSAVVSALVFASVTPPLTSMKAKTFVGFWYVLSKSAVEIVTVPNGAPPFGGL